MILVEVFVSLKIVSAAESFNQWPHLERGTPEYQGFQHSLALIPPENILFSPEEVHGMSIEVTNPHQEASSLVLFSYDSTVFDHEGYYHLIQQEAVKILNNKGVAKKCTVRLEYDLPYDRTRVLRAFIVQQDGSVDYLSEDNIRDVSNSDDIDANIFEPIWRSIVLTYPGVAPGSTLYWAYEHVAVKPRTPDSFQWGHTFRSTEPVLSARIYLSGPVDMPIYWVVTNNTDEFVSFQKDKLVDNYLYRWESTSAEMIREEPGMIPVSEIMTSLLLTTDDWKQVAAREIPFIEENLIPDEAIREKVGELTAGLKTKEAKMEALFMYVTKRVRYMGVAFGDRPGVNPDPVTRTFANNAGVCKDKAGLLTAMLRIAGIEACYTLNNPAQRIVSDVAVDQFNHAIVAARIPGESHWRFLDVTSDLSRSMCPASSGGTQVLRIVENTGIETIPISGPEANTGHFTGTTTIHPDGHIFSKVFYTGEGTADQHYREPFYYVDRSQWSEIFSYLISSVSLSSELVNWSIQPDQADDLSTAFSFNLEYNVRNYVIHAGPYMLFRAPLALSPFDWFYDTIEEICGLNQRKYPAEIGSTSRIVSKETIYLPTGYKLYAVPDQVFIESDGLSFRRHWTLLDSTLIMEQELKVMKPRISPTEFPEFSRVFREIRKSGHAYLILEESK
ncbi:DUF3857 domain-containing transglutaminase family protein [bacterium]|nr:DUF3857 domain-containing transglutaminase family protein [bacterium]